jgi:3',5'-cyclic AMP phosphodiesterase CpdA
MRTRRLHKRILAIALSAIILLASVPAGAIVAAANTKSSDLQIGVISDIHYYPDSLTGNGCQAFIDFCDLKVRQYRESSELLNTALNAIAKHSQENGLKYVLIPGDLTKDGEYVSHVELAQQLRQFEEDTGIEVFVINGNHDTNNSNACSFANGSKESTKYATPEEFREIYADFGYNQAYHKYVPPTGKKAGMLSYSVKLDGGYRLISVDSCKYSFDATSNGVNEHQTGGNITDHHMNWIINEISDAKRSGEEIIFMCHHNLVPHYDIEEGVLQGFDIDNWLETSETLADAGVRYAFTGHVHMSDICSHISDRGQTLYDITTSSLCGYPNTFREIKFTEDEQGFKADVKTFDVDCEENVIVGSTVHEKPFKYSYSFGQTYGKQGVAQFGISMANSMIEVLFENARQSGGIMGMLEQYEIDLESIFTDLIGEGVKVGDINIFTSKNLVSFAEDLAKQIDEEYINDFDRVSKLVETSVDKFMRIKVSDLPCTKFIDTLGFGDENRPGDLEDFAMTMVSYYAIGDEDISDDEFAKSALYNIEYGDVPERILDSLIEIIIDDILQKNILSQLELHISALFVNKIAKNTIGSLLDFLLNLALGGDTSYANLINFVFGLGILPYKSINDILNLYMDEYLTESQLESLGATMAWMAGSFMNDTNPGQSMDNNVQLCYSGRIAVAPTAKDFRLPSLIGLTLGEDACTQRNISWYTKYSVTGTDIEIVPYSQNPEFTGRPTTGSGIKAKTERVEREFPGVDLGIAGIFPFTRHLVRHTIEISGLEPGQKYCYRIGDAAWGWWSKTGIIETANGGDSFAFLHMTDPQSQNEKQYSRGWAATVSKAFEMFPESKFIVDTGDSVDSGTNVNQWQWFFDTAADGLMNTALMPAAGNHEKSGEALTTNFLLSNLPEQDIETGVYYSFNYNNAHFIVLNTNDLDEDKAISQEQINWLKQDAAASDAQWKILALHKPAYSNGSHFDDEDIIQIRKLLSTLMPELGIDVVLQGHDHVYLRTDVMDNNMIVDTQEKEISYDGREYTAKVKPQGTIYSITATAGVKYYNPVDSELTNELFPQAKTIVTVDSPAFASYHIEDNVLYYDAYSVKDGQATRIDSFAIEKEKVEKSIIVQAIDNLSSKAKVESVKVEKSIENVQTMIDENPQTGDTLMIIIAIVPLIAGSAAALLITSKRRKIKE